MPAYPGNLAPGGYTGSGSDDAYSQDAGERGERGYRRRKLASMAGNLYRSGQQAVTDLRDSYVQSRGRDDFGNNESTHIPGAFPDVAITSQGNEQMVIFPSYAKRHAKRDWVHPRNPPLPEEPEGKAEEWWRQAWERHEDEKAMVDVDVRGWIYSPHVGPMTRRNRILIGLARQLSGISVPKADQGYASAAPGEAISQHQLHEEIREQEKIEREAAMIVKRGQEEKKVAYSGGYSEGPKASNASIGGNSTLAIGSAASSRFGRRGSNTSDSAPTSPNLSARQNSNMSELSEAEVTMANANLMARVAPFLTNPRVALPITIFFYSETNSQSRTVLTDDAGHFNVRAALEFIPTHVRVLANEKLSATQEVKVTEPAGISLISDIDDTIKRSNISGGAREIFRNTFVRELRDLSIEGVREWYTEMHDMGVSLHYCSNSPWQLFPVLASFFKIAGLPPGSLHLKQYSGMLQGIFEPVAERKKSTLGRLVQDFPNRKFLLVGDSGEADLEVYTELALANPGRILAIFIRDVTTPETTGYFDSGFDLAAQRRVSSLTLDDGNHKTAGSRTSTRQNSAPGAVAGEKVSTGPVMGTLIDFSDEPEEANLDDSAAMAQVKRANPNKGQTATDPLSRKPPPPRPVKPAALRSTPSSTPSTGSKTDQPPPPPPPPRRPQGLGGMQPLTTILSEGHDSSQGPHSNQSTKTPSASSADANDMRPPPLPRRRSGLKSLSPRLFSRGQSSSNSDVDFDPLPPSAAPPPSLGFSYYRSGSRSGSRSAASTPSGSPTLGAQGVNKKLELWRRRLARAHEQLGGLGVQLYTWRTGQDVVAEAVGIVKHAMEDMERKGGRNVRGRR